MSSNPEKNPKSESPKANSDPNFKNPHEIKNFFHKMRLQSPPPEPESETLVQNTQNLDDPIGQDYTLSISDQILVIILSKIESFEQVSSCLVCKRWLRLSGSLVNSVKVKDWNFLESGRLVYRFPNLEVVDIVQACVESNLNSGILVSNRFVSVHVNALVLGDGFVSKHDLLRRDVIDRGIEVIANGCSNLRKLVLVGASEKGLSCVAGQCLTLQELEVHACSDTEMKGIVGFQNLQVLKLIGCIEGFYESVVSDIGLTILAQGCRRLVKLDLVGCEGSYDGIKAIGQCCQMLEELVLVDHRFEGGWLSALSYCWNLKTLKLHSCKSIDRSPGPNEHLGSCPTLEELHLLRSQMRDKQGVAALFSVSKNVKELVIEDCWGLEDDVILTASVCRRVTFLSLEGCSLITVEGLEPLVLSLKELKRLKVVACNNVKDKEITPALADLFSILKELKWRPDSRSLLSSGLEGTGVGNKGGRHFTWIRKV